MKTRKIYNIIMAAAMGISLMAGMTSCEDWLKEESYDFIQPDDIEDSDKGANQWLTGSYSKLLTMFNSNNFPLIWEYDSDYLTGPSWAFGTYGAGNFQNNSMVNALWEDGYAMIHRCNYSLYKVNSMTKVSQRLKTAINGELKFLKAWTYFQLVRAYGPIPLRKESMSETGDRNVPRSEVKDVYAYIIELLEDAETECYKNTDADYVKGHVTAGTAAGLLAKVYATMASGAMPNGTQLWVYGGKPWSGEGEGKAYTEPQKINFTTHQLPGYDAFDAQEYYTKAYKKAQQVMDKEYGDYSLIQTYSDLWKRANSNGSEFLWSLQPSASDTRYCEYYSYHFCGIEDGSGYIADGLWHGQRDHWYKMVESKDLRVKEGILHRWKRGWTYEVTNKLGAFYPNTEEYRKKVENKEAPYNDDWTYLSKQFDLYYLAYTTKYLDRSDRTTTHGDAFYPLLRLADIFLIYAEAYAEVHGTDDGIALGVLNEVRERSKATPLSLTGEGNVADIVDFRSCVLKERSIEFAFEGDRRWDLIRWGIYVDVMNAIGGQDEMGVNKIRSEKHRLFPIPSSEIDSNTSITENNPGWS
ncbi:RagB/SusD family nutrient uptake outer membrane protein [Bacteroides faecalis]|uniref:Membrane protein n=1 Tax=Bacteroides faecalis TaxID=2447885 RepID=A0A401LPC0_9BACE|nr:RagB/SusD family nutrient uptake outer membrane protein [Bacteroides faecalis]GCB33412.1 membrane protein [Bacteroides faecalis]